MYSNMQKRRRIESMGCKGPTLTSLRYKDNVKKTAEVK